MALTEDGIGRAAGATRGQLGLRADVVIREAAIGGIAGLIAGALVFGLGGRLFMRIAAIIDPAAAGLTTSNGNRIATSRLTEPWACLQSG